MSCRSVFFSMAMSDCDGAGFLLPSHWKTNSSPFEVFFAGSLQRPRDFSIIYPFPLPSFLVFFEIYLIETLLPIASPSQCPQLKKYMEGGRHRGLRLTTLEYFAPSAFRRCPSCRPDIIPFFTADNPSFLIWTLPLSSLIGSESFPGERLDQACVPLFFSPRCQQVYSGGSSNPWTTGIVFFLLIVC